LQFSAHFLINMPKTKEILHWESVHEMMLLNRERQN